MSIRVEIQRLLDAKRLFLLPPYIRSQRAIRSLFVTPEVYHDVMPPFPENWDGERLSYFRASLDNFRTNDRLTVAEDPRNKSSSANLARVDPVPKEVWDIRSIDPNPGVRCFGSFADFNSFVALTWDYRENLETEDDWADAVSDCIDTWHSLFPNHIPHSGGNLDAYLVSYRAV